MPPEVRTRAPLPTITIALAPDAPVVTAGVTALLRASGPDVVVLELVAGRPRATAYDVVLYDPLDHDPGAFTCTTLIAYSWSTRSDVVTQARAQGAVALLSKALPAVDLITSIRSLHAGDRSRFVLEPEADAPRLSRSNRADGLTGRELEVLQMIAEGWTNDEIAGRLFLSINSVKTYIRTAYRKIGVSRRPQAVLWGVHEGLSVRRHDGPTTPPGP